jgi:hypothetical protein
MTIAPRYRLPVAILASVALVALVFVGVSFLGQPDASDQPIPTETPRSSATAPAGDTPESAVHAFFAAFAEARETSDPSVIEPYVTGTDSSGYLTAAAFLNGQAEQGKGSVTTVQELTDFDVTQNDDSAVVEFTYLAGGYDIDLDTGEPLESPEVLEPSRVRAQVIRIDGQWLLDSYEEIAE